MQRPRPIIWIAALLLLPLSCSGPVVTAVGESNDLVIIHDGEATGRARNQLVRAMESGVDWLLGEAAFNTTVTTPTIARDLRNRRQILVVGIWNGGDVEREIARKIRSLDRDAPPRLHIERDIWAKGQTVGVIMGGSEDALVEYISEHGPELLSEFETAVRARAVDKLRSAAAESGATDELGRRFGWSLAPPTGYDFFTTDAADGFVFFRRIRPDRTVFVFWQEGEEHFVTEEFVVSKRAELSRHYYDGDEIEWRRPLRIEPVEFAGRSALRVSGWWGNRERVGGGPFLTYCFYEPTQGRVYLVDATLFAPSMDKVSFARNLDAVANTFAVHPLPER